MQDIYINLYLRNTTGRSKILMEKDSRYNEIKKKNHTQNCEVEIVFNKSRIEEEQKKFQRNNLFGYFSVFLFHKNSCQANNKRFFFYLFLSCISFSNNIFLNSSSQIYSQCVCTTNIFL